MMNKSQILKKIGNIIEELSEQQQYLAGTDKINLLELELFTANADFLIDHIEILKKLNDKAFQPEAQNRFLMEPEPEKPKKIEPENHQPLPDIPTEEESKKKFKFSFDEEPTEMIFDFEKKIAVEEVFDRPLSDDERHLLEEKSNAPEAKPEEFIILDDASAEDSPKKTEVQGDDIEPYIITKEEKATEVPSAQQQLDSADLEKQNAPIEEKPEEKPEQQRIDTVQPEENIPTETSRLVAAPNPVKAEPAVTKEERPLTLNEMLSAKLKQGTNQSGQRQGKKLEDLKTAISINDKMVFIKELFNGYNLAYSEAIEIVNRFESFDAADNFLQKNYAVKNDWENKQVTVARFYEYLHKKFLM